VAQASFDVAVVGGGSAGLAAAVSAARIGSRTLLVERSGLLGGNASLAYVHTICGLFAPADAGEASWVHPGFPRRFALGLRDAGAAAAPERAGRVHVLPVWPPRLAAYAGRLCAATRGLEVWKHTELVGAAIPQEDSGCATLRLRTPAGGDVEVGAQVVIDTTGDASVAALGGAECVAASPTELQIPSFIFRMDGVDTSELAGFARLRVTHAVAAAVRSGALPAGCDSVLVRRGEAPDEVYLTLNLPRPTDPPYAPLDPACLAELERVARRGAQQVAGYLRETRPAFRKCRILAWPQRVGVRETRRLQGLACVGREDVLEGRVRDDEVALSSWPIELWSDHRRARLEYPDAPCSVPLGALVSRSHPRLGAAGRCLSASHEALGALRVIGTSLATGEAVGVAAALAADARSALTEIAAQDVRHHILRLAEAGEAL
jgi:hypothetical protein